MSRFAVIGGGISGLTAAFRLSKLLPWAEVVLFEASDRLGGVLYTHKSGDLLVERGADSFLTKFPWAVELCRELGIEDQLIPTNESHRRALVFCRGRLVPVPEGFVVIRPHSLLPMLKTPLLSWRGKLRVLMEPWIAPAEGIERLNYDESVASFATRRLGKEVFERLVQPLLAGIYTTDPYQLSLSATMPDAIAAEREHGSLFKASRHQVATKDQASSGARYSSFVAPRGGLSQLVKALASHLATDQIILNCGVDSIQRANNGNWRLNSEKRHLGEFDGLIIATPAPRAAVMLSEVDATTSAALSEIPYASSAIVSLAFRKAQVMCPINGFGIIVPTVENRAIIAASFSSIKFPARAPADQLLVRVFLGGALQPERMQLTEEELKELALSEVRELMGVKGDPVSVDVVRWHEKMPQYHLGHEQLVKRIEERVESIAGIELAGNAYHGVGIPQCVHSGDIAARRIAGNWSDASDL